MEYWDRSQKHNNFNYYARLEIQNSKVYLYVGTWETISEYREGLLLRQSENLQDLESLKDVLRDYVKHANRLGLNFSQSQLLRLKDWLDTKGAKFYANK